MSDRFETCSLHQLKNECKLFKLKVSGTKEELKARLRRKSELIQSGLKRLKEKRQAEKAKKKMSIHDSLESMSKRSA